MTIAEERAAALDLYQSARDTLPESDPQWRDVADMLAALIPKPRQAPQNPFGFEWCEYRPGQHKGRGNNFKPMQYADFVFSDLTWVRAPMIWRKTQDAPDWSRAARMAVHFYRARFWRGERGQVPAIIMAADPTRNVYADPAKASEVTAELRNGADQTMPAYLSSDQVETIWADRMRQSIKIAA